MVRTVFFIFAGLFLVGLSSPRLLLAQAVDEDPQNEEAPAEDQSTAYDLSSSVKADTMGLFMPDSNWKKIKTGLPKMKVGTWVEYDLSHPEMNLGTLKISVVPQSDLPSPRWRILEILSVDATGDRTYFKAAFARASTDLRQAQGLTFKAPNMPPMIIPIGKPDASNPNALTVQIDQSDTMPSKVKYLGTQKIEVPAGTFETWHYRISGEGVEGKPYRMEIWFDIVGTVPVLRIVKVHENKTTMELARFGKGAKSDLPLMSIKSPKAP